MEWGLPGISYSTFAYSCHTLVEVSCMVGCLPLNIFNALLLSYRNNWYICTSNLAKYDLFFFLTRCWKIDLACLFMNSLSLYHNILHHTITLPGLGALPIVWGKAFVAALCNGFDNPFVNPCVTSSRGAKGSKSRMPLYISQLYTWIISRVNWYLASPLHSENIHPFCIHSSLQCVDMCDLPPNQ